MIKYLSSIRMAYKLLALGVSVFILLALIGGMAIGRALSEKPEPALKLSYCGAVPGELCVLSFGRDLENNMIISLFVPDRDFPGFYMKVKRAAGESIYECQKNEVAPTNVYCIGESIGLQEKMEIDLVSNEDGRLLAVGKLTLHAVLLSPVQILEAPSAKERDDTYVISETPTFAPTAISIPATATMTATPEPTITAYPGPAYP
jgi:hypothetical protein